MRAVSTGLLVLAFLLSVVDGATQDKGLYPSSPGRLGFIAFARAHPWLMVAMAFGIAGTLLGAIYD